MTSRFVLENALDQVPCGSAYRAIDTAEGRNTRIALWLLPERNVGASSDALRQRFRALQSLDHPNIPRVFELGRSGSSTYLCSEYLDGETLRNVLDHLRPERLDGAEAAAILQAVGAALAHAHDRGVVHGEVRAENVLVTMDQRFMLTNFMADALLHWRAGPARVADDVHDFAALAYELITGQRLVHDRPPAGSAPKRLLRAIEAVRPPRHSLGVREFMRAAGLMPGDRLPKATVAPPPKALGHGARAGRPRRSMWRFAVPFIGVAAVAFTVHTTDTTDELLEAGQKLKDWSAGMLESLPERVAANDSAATPSPAVEAGDGDEPVSHAAEPAPHAPAGTELGRVMPPPSGLPAAMPEAAAEPAVLREAAEPPVVSFAVPRMSVRENQSVVPVDIVRSGGPGTVSVTWWTTDDTATPGDDYASFGRRVETFGPDDTRRTVHIPLVSDSLPEVPERFIVHLAPSRGAKLGPIARLEVTIVDDDL